MLMRAGIKDVPTTVCNPQGNTICERSHQSMAITLWILLSQNPAANIANVGELVDSASATDHYMPLAVPFIECLEYPQED
jgi:hypothetical protein